MGRPLKTNNQLRRVLITMRQMPFWVTGMYIPYVVLSLFGGEPWYLAKQMFFISPSVCLLVLIAGHPFQFCVWWKIQCIIPAVPTAAAIYKHYHGLYSVDVCIASMLSVFILTIINGIAVFHETKQKL